MNKTLPGCCMLMLIIACSKSSPENNGPQVEYTLNGTTITVQGNVDSLHHNSATDAALGAYAVMLDTASYGFVFGVDAVSSINFGIDVRAFRLNLGNDFGLGMRLNDRGTSYGLYNVGRDSMVVHISRYASGTIDGTFSGSVSDSPQTKTAVIANGRFHNLRVYAP